MNLQIPALKIQQGPQRSLYCFSIDGKHLSNIAAVSRLHRQDESTVAGYQRPEVYSHIQEIRDYLESESPMIPNALVVAFDSRVKFDTVSGFPVDSGFSKPGVLSIPLPSEEPDWEKPGWVVDGQQRLAAIREAEITSFPMAVVAFITESDKEQREQFILVNSTKPLPKGLIYELLPTTNAKLPSLLHRRRYPAKIMDLLNTRTDSPLKGMILTQTCRTGVIKDNSVLKMIENSLSDGVLYRFREPDTGEGDTEQILKVLQDYWKAISQVFPDAWGLNSRKSRLMHGAGVVSMGFVMDAISDRHRKQGCPSFVQFQKDLLPLKEICRWTEGYWDFGGGQQRKWNEIQNTPPDVQLLTNYLLRMYRELVWNRGNTPH